MLTWFMVDLQIASCSGQTLTADPPKPKDESNPGFRTLKFQHEAPQDPETLNHSPEPTTLKHENPVRSPKLPKPRNRHRSMADTLAMLEDGLKRLAAAKYSAGLN